MTDAIDCDIAIHASLVEDSALAQLNKIAGHPAFSGSKIRIMPDVHAGSGCVIGFTATLVTGKIIPNMIGVDIGCGVLVAALGNADIDYRRLDAVVKRDVPSGRDVHSRAVASFGDIESLRCLPHLRNTGRFQDSIGTLGGGNHFIAIEKNTLTGEKYLLVHTGSRGLGKQVADYYQQLAISRLKPSIDKVAIIADMKKQGRQGEIESVLASLRAESPASVWDEDLCWLDGSDADDYLHDMEICQRYATMNRNVILEQIDKSMRWEISDVFHTVHNYIDTASMIVRKGAVSAKAGEQLIVPLNMRDGSLLCVGIGNDAWNQSAPHGAGRLMSRTAAFKSIDVEGFQNSMRDAGIHTSTATADTVDEAPEAYKPYQSIMSQISDTVVIVRRLVPEYNFKAAN